MRADFDLVSIATPHHLHGPQVRDAAEKRVGIICEKPMAPTVEEGYETAEAIKRAGIFFTVSHNFMYTPGNQKALEMLSTHAPGRRILGRTQSSFPKAAPLNQDYWRNRNDMGGGTLNDTCYHEIYQIEKLLDSPIRTVSGRVGTRFHAITADDCVALVCEHESGALSLLFSSWFADVEKEPSFCEVQTEDLAVRVMRRGLGLHTLDRRTTEGWRDLDLNVPSSPADQTGHAGFFRATLEAFRTSQPGPWPIAAALHQLSVIDAARRSESSGRRESVVSVPNHLI